MYHRVTVRVRHMIDQPTNLTDESFHELFKNITTEKIQTCGGCIELIKQLQQMVFLRKKDVSDNSPIFFDRLEKTKYIMTRVLKLGAELNERREGVEMEDNRGSRFIGSEYVLELWLELRDKRVNI